MQVIIHLFLIITLFSFFNHLAAGECHPDDEAGLLAFKSGIISDPSGMLLSWIPGTDCCLTWEHLGCSNSQQPNRVNDISLPGQTDSSNMILFGTISPALSKLEYLQSIYLTNLRNLSGPFPTFLLNSTRLQSVIIDINNLSGKLPKDIGNRLSSQLVTFSVEGNMFSGTIPTSLGQMTQLTDLRLGRNMFNGNIPYTIGNLTKLTNLHLEQNQLTGTIPDSFKRLTSLEFLRVSHNKLNGEIPEFIGTLNQLNSLDLSWNQFQGIVPKSFANRTQVFSLDLSHNSLTGPFPELKVLSTGMSLLDLSYNQFQLGRIPDWITSSQITTLKLAKCGISIKLDDWNPIYLSSDFGYIDLSDNNITGSPVRILNRGLERFYASGNKLKFNLQSVKITPTLKFLDLSRNLIFGKVPQEVSGLDMLNVSNNHLCGQLPKTNFSASSFVGNDCLCGSPLPKCKA